MFAYNIRYPKLIQQLFVVFKSPRSLISLIPIQRQYADSDTLICSTLTETCHNNNKKILICFVLDSSCRSISHFIFMKRVPSKKYPPALFLTNWSSWDVLMFWLSKGKNVKWHIKNDDNKTVACSKIQTIRRTSTSWIPFKILKIS